MEQAAPLLAWWCLAQLGFATKVKTWTKWPKYHEKLAQLGFPIQMKTWTKRHNSPEKFAQKLAQLGFPIQMKTWTKRHNYPEKFAQLGFATKVKAMT